MGEQENIFANNTSDKRLTSKIYVKQSCNSIVETDRKPPKRSDGENEQAAWTEDIQTAGRHSTSHPH